MTPDEYCLDRTRRSGSSFYYSFLTLDRRRRQAIMALYAFCREVDDAVDECSEPALARVKLEWWRGEVAALNGGSPQHPVSLSLQAAGKNFALDHNLLLEIIDGMEMDLDRQRYPDFRTLSLYTWRVAGAVGLLAATIFGFSHPATARYAIELGHALQLINILRDIREDAERGRIYLPAEALPQGLSSIELLLAARDSTPWQPAFRQLAERARNHWLRAQELLADEDRRNQRPGLIMAELYLATLKEMEQDGLQVLERRVRLTPHYKIWLVASCLVREWLRRPLS